MPDPTARRRLTRKNVVADHAASVRRNPDAFVTTLLRSRSRQGREILAHLATGGAATWAELLEMAHRDDLGRLGEQLQARFAGRLAAVVALQGPHPDPRAGLVLFDAVERQVGMAGLHPRDRTTYLQLLSRDRRRHRALRLLRSVELGDDQRAALVADLHSPFLYPDAGLDERRWLARFSRAMEVDREVVLRSGAGAPFDRLWARPGRAVNAPQKITVITSAYNPDHSLLGAVRSLQAQSWRNWEMLVVDDASTAASADGILRAAQRLDPRVRVIRKAVNGGTYRARNTALMQAAGEFVTCLDSDDWAHPDRLLAGVEAMLTEPGIVATRSDGVRVTEDLELARPGYRPLFPAASSLMFRVHPVTQRIGFFDPVRKGADTEYARRIESAFGRRVADVGRGALTILRGGDQTLSASEFSAGWRHPVRWAYKQSYSDRHVRIREGRTPPFVEPEVPQRSPGTRRWLTPTDPDSEPGHLDVVLAGDWRRHGGPQISMIEEIEALLADGLRVGVMHLEAMRFFTGKDQPLSDPLRELLNAGRVTLVHPDDDVAVDLLMLRYPPILQFPPSLPAVLRPGAVLIVANQAPAEKDGSDQRYVPRDVHRNAAELFGIEPTWVPQSPLVRSILQPMLPPGALAGWDNPAVLAVDDWHLERAREPGARLVVGRFSRDDAIKFPRDADDLLQAYDLGPQIEVRMMGATNQVERLMTEAGRSVVELPSTWTVLPHRAMEVRDFLSGVDVVVYLDHPDANESFGRALLESVASGVVVIASPKHETNFGDALLYAQPHEVRPLVERLLASPGLVAEQLARADARVRENWSREAFLARVRGELRSRTDDLGAPPREEVTGHIVLEATRTGSPVVAERSGTLQARTVPARRFADGELHDTLTVAHTTSAPELVDAAMRMLLAGHRPGERAAAPEMLPAGVHAAVWYQDGEWTSTTARGLRVVGSARSPRLRVEAGAERSGG